MTTGRKKKKPERNTEFGDTHQIKTAGSNEMPHFRIHLEATGINQRSRATGREAGAQPVKPAAVSKEPSAARDRTVPLRE